MQFGDQNTEPDHTLRQLTFQQNRFLLRIGTTSRVWKFPTF